MSAILDDILTQIDVETSKCVEDTRNHGLNFLKKREAFYADCYLKARQNHEAELEAAKSEVSKVESAINDAFLNDLKEEQDISKEKILVGLAVSFIVVLLFIKL